MSRKNFCDCCGKEVWFEKDGAKHSIKLIQELNLSKQVNNDLTGPKDFCGRCLKTLIDAFNFVFTNAGERGA